jgi:hypothetical protein
MEIDMAISEKAEKIFFRSWTKTGQILTVWEGPVKGMQKGKRKGYR